MVSQYETQLRKVYQVLVITLALAHVACGNGYHSLDQSSLENAADTDVAHDWQHGEIVTLTPSMFNLESFGADPNVRLFDTVDNQLVYSGVNNGDEIPVGVGYPWLAMSASPYRVYAETGAGIARHKFDNMRYRFLDRGFLGRPASMTYGHPHGRKLFVEWWQRMDSPVEQYLGSNKIMRVWGNSAGSNRYLSWTNQQAFPSLGNNVWTGAILPLTDWTRFAVEIDASPEDVLDWRIQLYVNGEKVVDRTPPLAPAYGSHPDLSWAPPTIGLIGWDRNISEANKSGRFTDIYMSVSPQRFVITDSATYGPTQNYEVQEIVSWSPNAVQIRLFEGALDGFEGKHVHFVSAGNAAAGTSHGIQH